jgi:hypothetical protein
MTTTKVGDRVRLSFSTSLYYLSLQGDDSKSYAQALYDPFHRILAVCVQKDAWTALSVVADVPPPPFNIVHANLARVTTAHGIHLGSTIADVEAVYGRAPLLLVTDGEPKLSYVREIYEPSSDGFRNSPEGVETSFWMVNGRVASILIGTGF